MSASPEHPSIFFHQLDDHHQLDFKTIIIRLSSVSKSTRGLSNNHMRKRNVLNLLSASLMIMMAMSATRWTKVIRCSTAWFSWQQKMLSKFWLSCIQERSTGCQLESTAYTGSGRPEVVSVSQPWKRCNFGDRPVSGFAVCESKIFFTAPPYFLTKVIPGVRSWPDCSRHCSTKVCIASQQMITNATKPSPAPASSPSTPPWSCSCSPRQTAKPGLGGVDLPGQEQPSSVQACRFSDQWSSIYV